MNLNFTAEQLRFRDEVRRSSRTSFPRIRTSTTFAAHPARAKLGAACATTMLVATLSQPETLNAQNSAEIAHKCRVLKSRQNEHFQRKTPRSRPLSDLRRPHDGSERHQTISETAQGLTMASRSMRPNL
jgi:hypothetical protein